MSRARRFAIVPLVLLGFAAVADAAPRPPALGEVVGADWVAAHAAAVQLVDARPAADFAAGHLPGAHSLPLASLLATIDGVPEQVLPPDAAQAAFRSAGLERDRPVVVYGAAVDPAAARVAWTLRHYGHASVAVLDGGFGRWKADRRALETGPRVGAPSRYVVADPGRQAPLRVDAAFVRDHLSDPHVRVLDARSPAEFAAGHVPGARHLEWSRTVHDGALRPDDELRALAAGLDPNDTIVTYCKAGARASVDWIVLRKLGFRDVRVYDGSWNEWGARKDLPKATAAAGGAPDGGAAQAR